jgi:hypothetical protein
MAAAVVKRTRWPRWLAGSRTESQGDVRFARATVAQQPQLGPPDRLLALVAWRHRVCEHLPNRLSRQPKLPGHHTLTPTLNTNRSTYPPVSFAEVVPPPFKTPSPNSFHKLP